MYSYKCKMNNIDVESELKGLKRENPDVTITVDRIEGDKRQSDNLTIFNFSVPIEKLKYTSPGLTRVFPGNHSATFSCKNILQGNYLEEYDYEQLAKDYRPKIQYCNAFAPNTIIGLVQDLKLENPSANIDYSYDECERTYKLKSSRPFSELRIPAESRFFNPNVQYGFDKDGYIFLQSEKNVKFEVDDDCKVHETRPFYIDKQVVNYANEKNGYHYDASYRELETVKNVVAKIKSTNPEIDIFIEKMLVPDFNNDSLSKNLNKCIITSSVDISKILANDLKYIHAIDQEEYLTIKILDKEKVLKDFEQRYFFKLQENNLLYEIVPLTDFDENFICVVAKKGKSLRQALDRISREGPDSAYIDAVHTDLSKCELSKKGIKLNTIDQIMFKKDKEGNGYAYFTKGETYTRYKCNEKGEFTMEHPFESKGNDEIVEKN